MITVLSCGIDAARFLQNLMQIVPRRCKQQ